MYEFTPLHHACRKNSLDVVKVLLEQPTININAQDIEGDSPLHIACINNVLDTVKFLIEHPTINLSAQNRLGYTAFDYAFDSDEEVINGFQLRRVTPARVDVKI